MSSRKKKTDRVSTEDFMRFSRVDEFKLVEEHELPMLFLGMRIESDFDLSDKSYLKHPVLKWRKMCHQTAGIGCHHHYLWGARLPPRNTSVERKMKALSEKWLDSNAGTFCSSLEEIIEYRNDIRTLFGVDCDHEYRDFEEGIYPMECSERSLKRMTSLELPERLDSLLKFKTRMGVMFGIIGRWKLYVLGHNCD